MQGEHAQRRSRTRGAAARWLATDAREVARIEARGAGTAGSVRSIVAGTARWRRSIARRRSRALLRRGTIVGLGAACLLQLAALATGRSGIGPWLVPAAVVGVLSLGPGIARGTSLATAARMLDRDLGLGAQVATALELEQHARVPRGLEGIALADGRAALGRSVTGARARLRTSRREQLVLAALAAVLVVLFLLPAYRGGTTAQALPTSTRVARHAATATDSNPLTQKAGPDLRGYGAQQETLPPLRGAGANARRAGAAGAKKGLYGGQAGQHRTGSVQPASRTVGNAGYLQTAKTSSARSNASSAGAAAHGTSTLTTHEAPAASPISSSGATTSTTPLSNAQQQATGQQSTGGIPGRTRGGGGSNRGGANSSAAGNSRSGAAHQAAPGGATAGATHGTSSGARGVVPQLGTGKTLPIQPGYEAVKGAKGGNGEDTSNANGAGGASHNGHATSGAAAGANANGVSYVPPGGATVAPADRRLLIGYFGSYARVSAAGW